MGLQEQVMQELKTAMKAKDTVALESLRAIKSALLLAKTDKGGGGSMSGAEEIALVQKLVKQRKDSAAIFVEQGREDLAAPELAEAAVIEQFLPEALSDEEIEKMVQEAEEFADQDKAEKEKVQARNECEAYLYNLKNSINLKES